MAAMSPSFRIYELLNKYFKNDADAKALVNSVEQLIIIEMQAGKENLATGQDIHNVREDISALRLSTREDIHIVKEDISALRISTREDISRLEITMERGFKEQLKWMIVFMVGLCTLSITVLKIL